MYQSLQNTKHNSTIKYKVVFMTTTTTQITKSQKRWRKWNSKNTKTTGLKNWKNDESIKPRLFLYFHLLHLFFLPLENCLTDLFYIYGQDCFYKVQLNFQMNITLRRIWFLPSVGEKEWLKRQVCELQIYWEFVCTEQCWTFKLLFCINNNNTLFNLFISSIQKWYPIQGAPPQWSPKSK